MKQKLYLLFLFLLFSAVIHSQINDIARLPVQDISLSFIESVPVWLSENEIITFYISQNMDTIFSTKSTNSGLMWQETKVVQAISLIGIQDGLYLTAIKTFNGRILLAWSVKYESMKLIYSDDDGESWSQTINILGGGFPAALQKNSEFLNLTQWDEDEICLSFSNSNGTAYYKLSSDNGVNWSANPIDFPVNSPYQTRELTILSINQNTLLGIYGRKAFNVYGIYSRLSTDIGLSWSEPQKIADEIFHEDRPKVTKLSDGSILVAYQRDNINAGYIYGDNDIYYKVSQNNGSTWSEEIQFTKYIGNDIVLNLSSFQNKTFITFSSERYTVNDIGSFNYQIAFGVLQESLDKFTPPKVYEAFVPAELINYEDKEFVYRAKVIDDEKVESVVAVMEDSAFIGKMFDDGLHNDEAANDYIFGNIFPFVRPQDPNQYSFDVNKIELPMNNAGVLADVYINYSQGAAILTTDLANNKSHFKDDIGLNNGTSQGKYDEGSFLFSAGFLLSGYSNGEFWSNGIGTSMLVRDYLPGTVYSNPDDPQFHFYIVKKDDIPFGKYWKQWKEAVLLGAEFYDGDGDGIYTPIDKNWNGTWDLNEDMPLLLGAETAWCVYNDGLPDSMRRWQSEPQGIEVRQTVFATNQPELENVIFIRYSILNTGLVADVLDSIYFGVWEDADLGDHTDDVVGCDTLLKAGFYYNKSPDAIYGENCPSFFTSLLQGPVINTNIFSDTAKNNLGQIIGSETISGSKNLGMTSHVFFIGGSPDLSEPGSAIEARCYLEGKTRQCVVPDPCNFPYCEVKGGVDCNEISPLFWASGDPVANVGWINKYQLDQKNLIGTGPFKLEKNKPQDIIVAYVMGRGTDYLNSITVARENVQRAIEEYKSNFASMTYSPPPSTNPVTSYILYQNYPNPFNPITTIRYELPLDGVVTIDIFNILGQKVKTILNEFKRANRYEVRFNSTGLASGVYIYRMRVNDFITSKKMLLIK